MKNLILSSLIVGAASQAAGCIIVDGDAQGDATVTWSLVSADAQGNTIPSACPAGATTAVIYALENGAAPSEAYQDKYNCTDGAGRAADLPPGDYAIWVRLTDDSETTLYAESGSLIANIVDGGTTNVPHQIFTDHAFYTASWTLAPTAGGTVTCGQVVGEDGVSMLATNSGGGFVDTIVDCESGDGANIAITDPLPSSLAGSQYTMAISLLNTAQQSIGDAPTIAASPDRALNYGNEYQDLGGVTITVR